MPTSAVVKYPRRPIAHGLLALCTLLAANAASAAGDCDAADAVSLVGQAALDGDTLRTEDGREWRLAGVLAPKRGDGARLPPSRDNQWPHPPERQPSSPADAARVALKALVQGQSLWLRPLGETADRHGRRIATVFDASCKALAEQLLLAGHVRVYPTPASRQLVVAYYRLE
ncbi:MAG TPA: hypothetical protein VJ890_09400, partial [Vineibacter sp.]|nr:hypothetical protein [Vineibacter sp.]